MTTKTYKRLQEHAVEYNINGEEVANTAWFAMKFMEETGESGNTTGIIESAAYKGMDLVCKIGNTNLYKTEDYPKFRANVIKRQAGKKHNKAPTMATRLTDLEKRVEELERTKNWGLLRKAG